jgi:protein required for attachment to host cells
MQNAGLYFVLADGRQARFVRQGADNSLHTVGMIDFVVPEPRDHDPPEDAANPGDVSDHGEPAVAHRARFAEMLAARIDEDYAVDLFIDLVLVAPSLLLRELTARLDPTTAASLIGSLAKDLVGVPDLELWPHLRPWIGPEPGE